ncbi:MAG: DUF2306 domain-containing protein [Cyclobacteriaceae bacterium]
MNSIVSGNVGLIHLASSAMAMILGAIILLERKGTRHHRRLGYVYVGCMVVLLVSSFMLYNLFGRFGIFHFASILSSLTLGMGMLPLIKRPEKWIIYHFSGMYWSVIGLYAAFLSELFTRVLPTPFFTGVGLGTAAIMIAGAIGFRYNSKKWENQFKAANPNH